MLKMRIGDRVTDAIEGFRGRLLGPSGVVYDGCPKSGQTETRLWAVEDVRTREVRHIREDVPRLHARGPTERVPLICCRL
jgi:hypothetical protein